MYKPKNVTFRKSLTEKVVDGEKIVSYDWKTDQVEGKFTQRFRSLLYVLYEVTGCQRDLIDWLPYETDSDNCFINRFLLRKKFIDFMASRKKEKSYKDGTVDKAIQDLAKTDLIIKRGSAEYKLNPEYFWTGEDNDRIKSIAAEFEFKAGLDTTFTVTKKYKGKSK